jgi:hypothetical protein
MPGARGAHRHGELALGHKNVKKLQNKLLQGQFGDCLFGDTRAI